MNPKELEVIELQDGVELYLEEKPEKRLQYAKYIINDETRRTNRTNSSIIRTIYIIIKMTCIKKHMSFLNSL